ncbi:MAG: hypothetical protein IJ575_06245 [Selenomonadaceae bacterium]|nr:hypothetical protein [Selenomonadaceae bacterium]
MDKVFEELGYSIEDKRYKRSFFNGKIPRDIRQDFLKIISITEKDKYSNDRPIPRDISNRLRKYFDLPEQSPWRVEDFLSVNLAGYLHFGDDKWEKDSKEIETKLLSKFPKRN